MSSKKNRFWLAVVIVLSYFMLTACGCKHEETEVINTTSATCTEDGYTGDTQCLSCEKIITKGEVIPATGHTEGNPTDVMEATCTAEGYTGNVYCITCGEMLIKGEAIAMVAHTPDDVHNATEATCFAEGYTGDVLCKVCGTMLSKGEAIAKIAHTPDDIHNAVAATCSAEGYTGDVLCKVCGETLTKGETIAKLAHTPDDIHNVVAATCSTEGFTGYVLCKVCGEILTKGETIAKLAHTPDDIHNAVAATCSAEGYTGDVLCKVCGELLEQGTAIEMLAHTWGEKENFKAATCLLEGYSGDQTCVNCGYTEVGSVSERLPHDFTNNTCTVCGWRVAGLYNGGELVFDWQQLLEYGLVVEEEIRNGSGLICLAVSEQLKGTLVVNDTVNIIGEYSEGVMLYGYDTFRDCKDITEVYIPSSVIAIGGYAFWDSGIETVHFAGEKLDQLGKNAFCGCKALKEITIPDGITTVPERCFDECASLEKVQLPSTIKCIEDCAFNNCAALTAIELSEGLEMIGDFAFSGTSIKEITLPASLKVCGSLSGISTIETIDMSKCQVTSLGGSFYYDKNLRVIHLPKTLESMSQLELGKTKVETLVLPQGFKTIQYDFGTLTTLKTIVWPFSFIDTERCFDRKANLETIYYEGTEAQWNALIGADAFPNATIVFNYNYEEGIE